MRDLSREITKLIDQYQGDLKKALQENSKLEYLYAISDLREDLLEWYPFRQDGTLLQVGSDYGAMTGLYSRKVAQVTVLDENPADLEVNRLRHGGNGNITYVNSSLEAFSPEKDGADRTAFDYVVMVGSLKPDYERQLEAAKSLLKPNGVLIVAVCNKFGMKYWAGAKKDEHSFSFKEITSLVAGEDKEQLELYYPMPDYKVPSMIYSQDYLPKKGDLTDTLTAYDYPRYLLLDVGAAYDAVCEDGQFENFANSFLLIWRNHGTD